MSGWVSVHAMNSASYFGTTAEFTSKPILNGLVSGFLDDEIDDEVVAAALDCVAIGSISSGRESAEMLIHQ